MKTELSKNFKGVAFEIAYDQGKDALVAKAGDATVTNWLEGPCIELEIAGESFYGSSLRFAVACAVADASVTPEGPLHAALKALGIECSCAPVEEAYQEIYEEEV